MKEQYQEIKDVRFRNIEFQLLQIQRMLAALVKATNRVAEAVERIAVKMEEEK